MKPLLTLALGVFLALATQAENWPAWRGADMNGLSQEKNLPVHWSPKENIEWKLALPAWSGATPIIWGDHVFLNVGADNDISLWCIDRRKQAPVWKQHLGDGNHKINKQNMSSPSPVTDGQNVWVMTGTGILKAFDFSGKELWMREIQKDYGRFGLNWGYASSPLLYGDSLYVQVLHGMRTKDASYLLRIDKKTGKTLWRVERPHTAPRESPDSYRTPVLLRYGNQTEIVIAGADCVTGHDPATGKELWRGNGLNPNRETDFRTIASPVVFDGIIYAPSRERPLIAFRAGGRDDISQSHKLWSFDNGPDVPTPVTDGQYFYSVNDRGILYCLDAKTGREIYGRQRVKPGTYSSSPVLADGKIYLSNEDGVTSVVKAGPKFEILAENSLDDYTLSSPAISEGQIFLRTAQALWVVGKRAGR